MAKQKTKEEKYEELLQAMSGGELGMAKFLWDLLERLEAHADVPGTKIETMQKSIDSFIAKFKVRRNGKDGDHGHTPTEDELINLIIPLIPKPKKGEKPTRNELLDLILSVMPDPVPGDPGDPGKRGKRGRTGPIPKHEWNGTLIRFENPDGSWGDWRNLQGSAGVNDGGFGGGGGGPGGGLERVRGTNFDMEGVSKIFFGGNLQVTRIGDGSILVDGTSGGGSGGGDSFEDPISGDVDDTNLVFIFAHDPKYIVVNGQNYFPGSSYITDISPSGGDFQVTLKYPVGAGPDSFIKNAYSN